jgi:hypothetical protein
MWTEGPIASPHRLLFFPGLKVSKEGRLTTAFALCKLVAEALHRVQLLAPFYLLVLDWEVWIFHESKMRPGSGMRMDSAGGNRPGSGRKPPGTGRLRTGVAPSGSGTIAGQGAALNAAVHVSERPVTGQGVKGMRAQSSAGGRIVYDASYYVGVLRKKISDVNNETIKLRSEIEQQSKDNTQYSSLERRYETLIKNKEMLEGQLADYNLALDKVRTYVHVFPYSVVYHAELVLP